MTSPALSIKTPKGRFYQHPRSHAQVPSITNVIGMKDKPALKWWAAKQAAIFAAQNLDTLAKLTEAERIDLIKGAPFRSTTTSSERGDVVHDWIDQFIKSGTKIEAYIPEGYNEASRTAQNMWKSFQAFTQKYQPKFIASEFTVWSDKHQYAGTGDFICQISGATIYADTKTGNGVYPEVGMQISALANADYMFDANGEPKKLPKCDRGAVLHVRPRFSRLHPLSDLDECFKAFLGLRACFEWDCVTSDSVIGATPKIEAK